MEVTQEIQTLINQIAQLYRDAIRNSGHSATGNLEKPSRINELRKLVARMKTILRERELAEK